jgi:hypothetical protein
LVESETSSLGQVIEQGSAASSPAGFVPSLSGSITSTVHASRELQPALKLSF